MKLHQMGWQRDLGQNLAPFLSKLLYHTGTTTLLRKIIAYLNYVIGRGAGTSWHLDAEVAAALACVHREHPVIFDVGANVGKWSQSIQKINGVARLYLFEPQKVCQQEIRNLELKNSTLICSAVGNVSGQQTLYSSSDTDGSASLSERLDTFFEDAEYKTFSVDVIRLDELIQSEKIDFVDFIKFDIEGHEFNALLGLRESLERKAVGAFSFEFGSGNLNSRTCWRDFWTLLSPQYNISIITPGGHLQSIPEYYEDLEYYRGVSNYIAVLKNHPFAAKSH